MLCSLGGLRFGRCLIERPDYDPIKSACEDLQRRLSCRPFAAGSIVVAPEERAGQPPERCGFSSKVFGPRHVLLLAHPRKVDGGEAVYVRCGIRPVNGWLLGMVSCVGKLKLVIRFTRMHGRTSVAVRSAIKWTGSHESTEAMHAMASIIYACTLSLLKVLVFDLMRMSNHKPKTCIMHVNVPRLRSSAP